MIVATPYFGLLNKELFKWNRQEFFVSSRSDSKKVRERKTIIYICHILSFYFFLNRVLFFGFVPQIEYQFAFTKTLRATHPSEFTRVPLQKYF